MPELLTAYKGICVNVSLFLNPIQAEYFLEDWSPKPHRWWSSDVKEAVKRKKWVYRKALNDKTDESWKLSKEARNIAKQVVLEAKEKDLVREGKMLQEDYLSNTRKGRGTKKVERALQ